MDIGTQATEQSAPETAAPKPRKYRIAIGVPAHDLVHAQFAQDYASMLAYTVSMTDQIELTTLLNLGTELPAQRHTIVKEALSSGCTHILWLDSDMRFPKDTLFQLLQHDEDIVAANYPTRKQPIIPTCAIKGEEVYIEPAPSAQPQPLFEIDHAGFGVMLVKIGVFEKVPRPWFQLGYNRDADVIGTEDVYFCHQARKHGFRVLCDPNLSRQVQHLGLMPFNYLHALQTLRRLQEGESMQQGERAIGPGKLVS